MMYSQSSSALGRRLSPSLRQWPRESESLIDPDIILRAKLVSFCALFFLGFIVVCEISAHLIRESLIEEPWPHPGFDPRHQILWHNETPHMLIEAWPDPNVTSKQHDWPVW